MFNRKLRQRVDFLENQLKLARAYTDSASYDCPLCGEIDPFTKIPYHYCALHMELARVEKKYAERNEMFSEKYAEYQDAMYRLMQMVNIQRESINDLFTLLSRKPSGMSKSMREDFEALLAGAELKIRSHAHKSIYGDTWITDIAFLDE